MNDPPTDGNLLSWLLWGVIIVVGTLSAVVGKLYSNAEGRNGRAIARLEGEVKELKEALTSEAKGRLECEKERSAQRAELEMLKVKVDEHERRIN